MAESENAARIALTEQVETALAQLHELERSIGRFSLALIRIGKLIEDNPTLRNHPRARVWVDRAESMLAFADGLNALLEDFEEPSSERE